MTQKKDGLDVTAKNELKIAARLFFTLLIKSLANFPKILNVTFIFVKLSCENITI